MGESCLGVWLILAEPLQNNRIGTLGIELDFPIRGSDDRRHAFPCRIELADVENLVFLVLAFNFDKNRFGFASLQKINSGSPNLEEKWEVARTWN